MSSKPGSKPLATGTATFRTTRWSVVCAAAASAPPAARRAALETLCAAYWRPLFAYASRRGLGRAAAEDRVQGFFARWIEKDDAAAATPERGRFRSFLLAAFAHYLANEHDRERTRKRGGDRELRSIDTAAAAGGLGAFEPRTDDSPERAFERAWAFAVLERARSRLRAEQARIGRERIHDRLQPAIAAGADTPPYRELALELGLSENAVKVAVHRLRKRLGELVRDEVLQTLDDPRELDEELAHLHRSLGA